MSTAASRYRLGVISATIGLALAIGGIGVDARAAVLGYTTKSVGSDTVLTSVVVVRGGGTVGFDATRLIRSTVTHFKSPHARNVVSASTGNPPDPQQRLLLLGDLKLTTGLINPGGQAQPLREPPTLSGTGATPGMAVRFERPVMNLPGDDVVIFEVQRGDSPLGGDSFHVGPLDVASSWHAVTIRAFDVGFDHPCAAEVAPFIPYVTRRPLASLDDLRKADLQAATSAGGFRALAVALDLSALGCPPGAQVGGLFLQDAGTSGAMVDPVLIVGLPSPEAPNILDKLPRLPSREPGDLLSSFLAGPLADVEEIVYAERVPGNDHWYANFGYYWCGRGEYPEQRLEKDWQPDPIFKSGGRLCCWNLRSGKLRVLLDDPAGGVRDPQVSYDGRKILFSFRKGGQPYYHLYEITAQGTGLRQLTDGPCDDFEPTYLPDGDIIFCSSRCRRVVNCWKTPVATMYRCRSDGTDIHPVSTNIEHDNTPWVLRDGRVIYMRWEYVDRSQLAFHHLWTINPDGTGQMVYYGNQHPGTASLDREATAIPGKHPGISMLDAKPIPGTDKVVASFSPRHGRPEHMGVVTVIDPHGGPDDPYAARSISRPGRFYRDPYALSEDCFLVANRQGILVMDGQGSTELVCRASGGGSLECHEPRPLRSRPRECILPSRVDRSEPVGRMVLSDVYRGRNMGGVRRGEITKLLILEQLPKPVNFSGGPWPLSIGGTFTLARVLGTVPVETDGSAYFQLPAQRSVFFVALDSHELSVKRMQSFVSVQPGETISCAGCHERRGEPPRPRSNLAALQRAPSEIQPFTGIPSVIDFPRDVQPILDRHCVQCHNPERYDGEVDLTGDHTPLFSQSYWTIVQRGLISDGRNEPYGNRPPRTIGTSASRLLEFLDGSHHDARLSAKQQTLVRLWIESSATYPGTYAALGSGMNPVVFPVSTMERRCGGCHGSPPNPKPAIGQGMYFQFGKAGPPLPLASSFDDLKSIRGSVGYFKFGRGRTPQSLCNLTRPDKSLLLRAPLARAAGGLELCSPMVFAGTDDSDYQTILGRIEDARRQHEAARRFDMLGFRPNDHYILQMQRFGILPPTLDSHTPIDVYATDQAYWQSFWYRPTANAIESLRMPLDARTN